MSSLGVQSPRMKQRQLLLSTTAHSTAHDPLCSTQIVTAVLIRSPLESIRTPNPNGGKQKRPNASRAAPRSNSSSLHDWLSWSVLPRLARLQLRPLPRRQNQIRWDSPSTRLHLPGGRLALPMSPAVVHIIVSFCSNIHLPGHQWDVQSWVLLQISRKKAKNAAKRSNWPRQKGMFCSCASQNQMRRVTNELSRFSKMLAKAPWRTWDEGRIHLKAQEQHCQTWWQSSFYISPSSRKSQHISNIVSTSEIQGLASKLSKGLKFEVLAWTLAIKPLPFLLDHVHSKTALAIHSLEK